MTPEEHYREAERLAKLVATDEWTGKSDDRDVGPPELIALAQVHATLALHGIDDSVASVTEAVEDVARGHCSKCCCE